jgi:cytochrome c biogenesis protein CcdA
VAELVVAITLIALPDSLNPSLILTELVLAGGPHPRRGTAVFTLSAMATTFVGGLVVAFGLGELILSVAPRPSPTVKGAVAVGAGAALMVAGIVLWLRRDRAPTQIDSDRALHSVAALLGVGIAGIELATAFPYFAAISLVVGSDVSTGQKVVLLALYNVVYALPLIAIATVCAVRGPDARRVLGPISDWLMRRWPAVVAVLTLVVGVAVLAYGLAGLVRAAM